ncbi:MULTISPECIES: DUF4097 family beta strand repeat-containing protein [unclassified Butyrivibrio]|uniref:DUF4097 family beta strand repeat-containing protein n=1 Tax=unclassified Butyrivibrio TaxID=2639466 RepID=UPI00040BE8E2|nr:MULTISPECIES: DUF4097 family beta strand repeat-containing protein [unclassified Butyrivibrio]
MNSKVILYLALGMSAFGFIIMATGFKLGAKPVISIGNSKVTENKTSEECGDLVTGSMELSAFDELDVDIASIGAYLVQGDSYKLEYQAYEENVPKVTESGHKLTIKQPSHKSFVFGFNLLPREDEQYYRITVPKDAGIIDVDMDAASGVLSVDGVNIKGKLDIASGLLEVNNVESEKLTCSAASGKIDLKDIKAEKLTLDLASGLMNVTGCTARDLDTELSSGTVTIDEMTVDNADFDITSGKVSLNLVGNKDDYSYDLDATSGSIKVDGASTEKKFKADGNTDKKIKADLTSGSFDVTFGE